VAVVKDGFIEDDEEEEDDDDDYGKLLIIFIIETNMNIEVVCKQLLIHFQS
jgi:hypothetical protein